MMRQSSTEQQLNYASPFAGKHRGSTGKPTNLDSSVTTVSRDEGGDQMPKIDYPDDGHMLVLLGLWLGSPVEVIDGEPHLIINPDCIAPMRPESLDILEHERGWITIGETQPEMTEAGKYWLRLWVEERTRCRDIRQLRLTARRI